ncbi:MAG: DUF4136 domain-containing protein [Candidatus Binatia bacterium]
MTPRHAPAPTFPANCAVRLAILLLLAVCGGCLPWRGKPTEPVRIESEESPTARLYQYRTYRWVWEPTPEPSAQRTQADLRDWRVRTAVEAQLAERGYEKATGPRADFLIDYHTEYRPRTVSTFSEYLKYRDYGGTMDISEVYVVGYEEAVLIVEIFDAKSRQLAWRASATTVVNPKDQQDRMAEAVRQIFLRFPTR